MEDHHVDRPDVEARQRVKLTGTNRSFDLIALVAKARERAKRAQTTDDRRQRTDRPLSSSPPFASDNKPVLLLSDDGRPTPDDGRAPLAFRPPASVLRLALSTYDGAP